MKKYTRFITFGCGLFTFFCFSLPWVGELTGIDLANSDNGSFIVLAFIACFVIVISNLIQIPKILIIICSGIGLFCMLLLFLSDRLGLKIVQFFPFNVQYGAFLTAIGFFLTTASVIDFYKTDENSQSND